MARQRRKAQQNWARGVFATFWILLGGISGAYLFTVFSNPNALGGQLAGLNPGGSAADGTTAAIGGQSSPASSAELAEIKASLSALSEQIAALNARVGPVAASSPAAATAPAPVAETKPPEVAAAPSAPPPAPAPPAAEAKPAQAETPKPAEAAKPEAKPIEQAAIEPAMVPKPGETSSEPPAVAVSPLEEDTVEEDATLAGEQPAPAPAPPAATELAPTPAEPPATESAALDPTTLPPAANDGSTRYGIEIGTVAKQDGLRPLWREFLTNHAALVAGLQPRRVLAPDKKWRLIAGPFGSAAEAAQACALFKKASRPCEATVYAGDSL